MTFCAAEEMRKLQNRYDTVKDNLSAAERREWNRRYRALTVIDRNDRVHGFPQPLICDVMGHEDYVRSTFTSATRHLLGTDDYDYEQAHGSWVRALNIYGWTVDRRGNKFTLRQINNNNDEEE